MAEGFAGEPGGGTGEGQAAGSSAQGSRHANVPVEARISFDQLQGLDQAVRDVARENFENSERLRDLEAAKTKTNKGFSTF